MDNLDEFYAESEKIVLTLGDFAREKGILEMVRADHVCYKCGSVNSFEVMRKMLEQKDASKWAYQSIIAGRRITLVRLRRPIETALGAVDILELSDQKPDNSQTEEFDHIEVYPTSGSYEELVAHLQSLGVKVKEVVRPHHTTHDIPMGGGYLLRLTREGLVGKVQREMTED